MTLAEMVYHATSRLPKAELYGIVSQMRRAAVSIPSNIAEGQARNSTAEFLRFLSIAKGSVAELETQLELARRLEWLSPEESSRIFDQLNEVGRMLNGLIGKLRTIH